MFSASIFLTNIFISLAAVLIILPNIILPSNFGRSWADFVFPWADSSGEQRALERFEIFPKIWAERA